MAAAARPAPSVRMKKYLGKCWLLNRISENWDKKLCAFFNSDYLESPHLIFYELQPGPEYDFENCPITYFVPMLDASCQDCFIQAEFDDGSNFKHGVKIGGELLCGLCQYVPFRNRVSQGMKKLHLITSKIKNPGYRLS